MLGRRCPRRRSARQPRIAAISAKIHGQAGSVADVASAQGRGDWIGTLGVLIAFVGNGILLERRFCRRNGLHCPVNGRAFIFQTRIRRPPRPSNGLIDNRVEQGASPSAYGGVRALRSSVRTVPSETLFVALQADVVGFRLAGPGLLIMADGVASMARKQDLVLCPECKRPTRIRTAILYDTDEVRRIVLHHECEACGYKWSNGNRCGPRQRQASRAKDTAGSWSTPQAPEPTCPVSPDGGDRMDFPRSASRTSRSRRSCRPRSLAGRRRSRLRACSASNRKVDDLLNIQELTGDPFGENPEIRVCSFTGGASAAHLGRQVQADR